MVEKKKKKKKKKAGLLSRLLGRRNARPKPKSKKARKKKKIKKKPKKKVKKKVVHAKKKTKKLKKPKKKTLKKKRKKKVPWPKKKGKLKKAKPKKEDLPEVKSRPGTEAHEISVFKAEIARSKVGRKRKKAKRFEILKVGVGKFDELIGDKGLERGSTILISGGCGTGKTTFALQSIYFGALRGQRGIFISFEEELDKIKKHMLKNFGWDFGALEKKGLVSFIKLDPIKVARKVEAAKMKASGTLKVKFKPIELPFVPDRLAVDSLSALSIAFEEEENYRRYIRQLFETFETYNSINFVLTETEQVPKIYSRAGIEEFLSDGVVVLYNIKIKAERINALEILKLRSSNHEKKIVPYRISRKGVEILPEKKIWLEGLR